MKVSKPVVSEKQTIQNAAAGPFSGRQWLGWPNVPGQADVALESDPALSAGWLGLLSIMAQAEIDIGGRDVPPQIREFFREMLFKKASRRFNNVFIDLLGALLYGVQPLQVLLSYSNGFWLLDDLWPVPARYFSLETIKKRSNEWWINGDLFVNGQRIKAGPPGSGLPVFFWATYGPGLFGRSILRPVMGDHEEKQYSRRLRGVGLTKSVLGTVALFERPPENQDNPLTEKQMEEYAETLADAVTARDRSTVMLPYNVASVQPIYAAADSITKTIDAENHADLSILQAFGSQHMARGLLSGYGSQGAGETDSRAQQALRGYYFQWAAGAIQPLLDWITDLNFGPQDAYPELSIISPEAQGPKNLVDEYTRLTAAGVLTSTPADADFFRRLLRLPQGNGQLAEMKKAPIAVSGSFDKIKGDTRDAGDRADYYMTNKKERTF